MKEGFRSRFTTLYINPEVMRRITYYAQAADGEVSGLGTIVKDEIGRHIVDNVYLLEQEATAADTEIKPEAISKLMTDMMKAERDPGTLKFWWHSHAAMGVFWSGTDDTCAETLSKEYAFSLVVNKAGEKKCRLDLYDPFRITFDGVRIEELTEDNAQLKLECEKEVREKVKTPYEKYRQNWPENMYNEAGYQGYRENHYSGVTRSAGLATRVNVPEQLATDIEDFIAEASINATDGGAFGVETWSNFIRKVLRDVLEKRFEKKCGCTSFATYSKEYDSCKDKKICESISKCQFWTKFLEECEEDAHNSHPVDDAGEVIIINDDDIRI